METPDPNPLDPYRAEIARVMLSAEEAPTTVEGRAVVSAHHERLKWQSRLGAGLFNLSIQGIRQEIRASGGPKEYLDQLSAAERTENPS
jgi:hypothetical protein